MKETIYSFGQFVLSVDNPNICDFMFPSLFSKYEKVAKSISHVQIHVCKQALPAFDVKKAAWNYDTLEGKARVTYCEKSRSIFSIVYDLQHREATVYVQTMLDRHILIGIQYAMLILLSSECIGLHGVTVLCNDQLVILSAPSGTGKTTLGKLLEKHEDAIIINGDFALLSFNESGEVIFEPTPFCGSSRRSLNQRFAINRIVFLEQGDKNIWRELPATQALTRLMNNCFVPEWNEQLTAQVYKNVLNLLETIPISEYAFLPTVEAAETFVNCLNKED